MLKLFLLALLTFSYQAHSEENGFIEYCNKEESQGIAGDISWLKKNFNTTTCEGIRNSLQGLKSFNQFIPEYDFNSRTYSWIDEIPLISPPKEIDYKFISLKNLNRNLRLSFFDLEIYTEFKNLIHFNNSKTNHKQSLCQILSLFPSIKTVTTSPDLNEQSLACLKDKDIGIFITGRFKPRDDYQGLKIIGFEDYQGDINELWKYPSLRFLGLQRYQNGKNEELTFNVFASLQNLTHLNLNVSNFGKLQYIGYLTKLSYLKLSCPKEDDLEGATNNCSKLTDISFLSSMYWLRWLDLSNHSISNLDAIAKLKRLERLVLRQNKLTSISSLASLNQLISVDLAGNKISDINSLAGFNRLKHLNISNNPISDFSIIAKFNNLVFLNIASTPNSSLRTLRFPTSLKVLNLSETNEGGEDDQATLKSVVGRSIIRDKAEVDYVLNTISSNFKIHEEKHSSGEKRGQVLKDLNWSSVTLTILSIEGREPPLEILQKMKSLDYLNLANSQLNNFSNLPRDLHYLNLRNNNIKHVPPLQLLFPFLEILNLSKNYNLKFNSLSLSSRTLEALDLSSTSLTKIPNVKKALALKRINLSHNKLDDIKYPRTLPSQLNEIDLSNNAFTHVPLFKKEVDSICEINLKENPIRDTSNIQKYNFQSTVILDDKTLTTTQIDEKSI